MMGYSDPPGSTQLIWACKGCGSTFTYNNDYRLTPYVAELHYPLCPRCEGGMVAEGEAIMGTTWRCPGCGERITF
jgi:transposase-like protein